MSRSLLLLLSIVILISCGDGNNLGDDPTQSLTSNTNAGGTSQASLQTEIAIADGFCVNQKKLQIISTSLLSAYAPKGNGSDLNYCGGSIIYTDNILYTDDDPYTDGDPDFLLELTDYCVNARGQQVIVNGSISGTTDSGINFFSSIISNLSIVGSNLNLDLSGNTWDGRADDNFMNLNITDNINSSTLVLGDVSIKKGELDFGTFTFPGLNPVAFQFIKHFNADNTEGLLFIYGEGEEKLIISGDNGMITAVYTKDRHDDGTWLDLPCNN